MDSKIAGSIAGAIATAPMTAVMLALHRALPGESGRPLPPREITENVAEAAGVGPEMRSLDEDTRKSTTLAAHFSYGAAAGVGYIAFAGKSGLPRAAEGALYGLAVWGASYLGLMPATGLYRSATDDPASRNTLMIAAHVVWGAALGVAYEQLRGRE